jgi:hypothetical protein
MGPWSATCPWSVSRPVMDQGQPPLPDDHRSHRRGGGAAEADLVHPQRDEHPPATGGLGPHRDGPAVVRHPHREHRRVRCDLQPRPPRPTPCGPRNHQAPGQHLAVPGRLQAGEGLPFCAETKRRRPKSAVNADGICRCPGVEPGLAQPDYRPSSTSTGSARVASCLRCAHRGRRRPG